MINSPIVRAEDLCFSEAGVVHSLRHLLIPWWNAYSFFVTYANIDGWQPKARADRTESPNLLDRWILSSLDRLTGQVVKGMDAYDLQQAVRPFVQFIDELTNWYIRRSRRRFWKSDDDADKAAAYDTLHTVLLQLCQIAAPFTPFIAEEIYRNLRTPDVPESVHLCDFPLPGALPRDETLEAQMRQVMTVVSLARQLRSDFNLKVRQPLAALHIICRDQAVLDLIRPLQDIVADELNVKEVRFGNDETKLAELSAKANFKTLGPKLGGLMKKVVPVIAAFDAGKLAKLLNGETVEIEIDGQPFTLDSADIQIQRTPKEGLAVASEGALVIALETELTPELVCEGLAREIVNRIQNLRKTEGLDVADRITLAITGDAALVDAVITHQNTIAAETLALNITATPGPGDLDINEMKCCIKIHKK